MSIQRVAPGLHQALLLFVLSCSAALTQAAVSSSAQLTTTEKQQLQREARLIVDLLQNHHHSGRAFREIDNREMVTRFIEELDPGADFFSTADIDYIHRRFDRTLKSVYLFRGDLQPAFEIFDLLAERAGQRLTWAERRLGRDFDLTADETYHRPAKPPATAPGEASDQRWERHLKSLVVREIVSGRSQDEARTAVARQFAEMRRRITSSDSFAIRERFFDAIIRSYDPHSGYFSADSAREFSVDMANAVTGLGLDLRKEEGRCVVSAVQPGGPADLHSTIGPGDRLIAVADGDGDWIDAASRRLRDIATLVRGEPGRKVRLAYEPAGTTTRVEVTLERARVVLPADRAHGAISEVPDPSGKTRRIGWIKLPSFYAGGEGETKTSAAQDLRELLDQMAAQIIDGLVLDLRFNPGGAQTEALAISQLFLPRGCLMLSRSAAGQVTAHNLKQGAPAYAGPLVVLTSAQSASASEILSGALKYYRRAVVVGGETTFGKGTAQNYIEMAKLPGIDANSAKDWGTLRLTTDRFYLPDGRAVQRAGVVSDIVLPDFDPPGVEREAALPHALPQDSITPPAGLPGPDAVPTTLPDGLLQHLRVQAGRNFQDLPEWKLWQAEQAYQQARFGRETRSLQLSVRQAEWEDSLRKYQANQAIRRELTATARYPTRPLEIASVQAALAAHEARLRALDQAAGSPVLHRLRRGAFHVETDQGRLNEIRLEDLGFTAYFGDTEGLAAAFSAGAGQPVTAAEVRRMLEAAALLQQKTDAALLETVAEVTGHKLSAAAVRAGTEAMLRRLTELDDDLKWERPGLDIPVREGQRLAAAWAAWVTTPSAP